MGELGTKEISRLLPSDSKWEIRLSVLVVHFLCAHSFLSLYFHSAQFWDLGTGFPVLRLKRQGYTAPQNKVSLLLTRTHRFPIFAYSIHPSKSVSNQGVSGGSLLSHFTLSTPSLTFVVKLFSYKV